MVSARDTYEQESKSAIDIFVDSEDALYIMISQSWILMNFAIRC